MGLIVKALRGPRVHVAWALLLLGMAGLNAAVLLHGEAGLSASRTVRSSHAPPPAQINTRVGAATAADNRLPPRDSLSNQRLTLSTTRLDLGDGKPNEIVRGELTLSNPNSSPVAFSLIKHCGCTELSPLSGTLPPRGKELIHVGLQLPAYANSEKGTSVEVRTGNPPEVVTRCVLSARCPAPFEVNPAFISFGSPTRDDVGTSSHELHLDSVGGQPPLDPETLLIEHNDDVFRVERVATLRFASAAERAQPRVTLRVTLRPGISPGDHYDSLDLRLAGSEYSMRVPLHVNVAEAITVVPATVFLRREPGARALKPVQLLIIDHRREPHLGELSLIDAPEGLRIEDLGDAAPERRRLRLSVDVAADAWPTESDVWLSADGVRFAFKVVKPASPGGSRNIAPN